MQHVIVKKNYRATVRIDENNLLVMSLKRIKPVTGPDGLKQEMVTAYSVMHCIKWLKKRYQYIV